MAKAQFPNYVQSALSTERKAQIGTFAALCVYVFGEAKAEREVAELGARLHSHSPYRSLKTWQNYASAVQSLAVHAAVVMKLESVWSQSDDHAEMTVHFAPWLEGELKRKGYTSSVDDVTNFAKGKLSIKGQEKAKAQIAAQEEADAQAAALAAAKTPDAAPATPTVTPPVADADPINPDTGAASGAAPQAPTGDENGTSATGYPAAILPMITPLFSAVLTEGEYVFTVHPETDRADFDAMIAHLEAKRDELPPESSDLPVIVPELIEA